MIVSLLGKQKPLYASPGRRFLREGALPPLPISVDWTPTYMVIHPRAPVSPFRGPGPRVDASLPPPPTRGPGPLRLDRLRRSNLRAPLRPGRPSLRPSLRFGCRARALRSSLGGRPSGGLLGQPLKRLLCLATYQ